MAGRAEIKAIGPSYHLADRKAGVQRSINTRISRVEGLGEDKQIFLKDVDGWDTFSPLTYTIRGQYSTGERYFVVRNDDFLELDTNGSATQKGTLQSSSGFVAMKHNSDQLAVVDGTRFYIFDLSTETFTEITTNFLGSDWVDYVDGYFTFVRPDSEQFYLSAIDDGTNLDALDFSSADRQPDKLLTHRVFKGEIYLFGEFSTEPWVNSGGADFPFVRYNATPIEVGIVGKRAVAITSDAIVWVGQTKSGHGYVYAMSGYSPVRISTQDQEEKLGAIDLTDCVLWTYHIEGAEFVGIEAPALETTLVYDLATKTWHERARGTPGSWEPMDFHSVVFHQGMHLAAQGTVIFDRNSTSQLFNGSALVRFRQWPHLISPSLEPVTYRSLEVACSTGNGEDCFLQISNDGGYTWGPLLSKSLGVTGRWMERVRWHFLGSARDRVFRLGCSKAVPFHMHSVSLDYS
jgi:hypothetical protein